MLDQMLTEKLEMAALLNTVGTDVSDAWLTRPEAPHDDLRADEQQVTQGVFRRAAQGDFPAHPESSNPQSNPAVNSRGHHMQAQGVQAKQLVFEDELIHAKALSESYLLNLDLSILEVGLVATTCISGRDQKSSQVYIEF